MDEGSLQDKIKIVQEELIEECEKRVSMNASNNLQDDIFDAVFADSGVKQSAAAMITGRSVDPPSFSSLKTPMKTP